MKGNGILPEAWRKGRMAHYIGSAPPLQRLLEANCRTGALHREAVRPKTERTLSGTDRRGPPPVPRP
ncbi:hypothetical protein KZ870_25810, partial [Pseudomonas aeruginosa]|nr:hypothetical protein [Pseudomonas aeruginosa]